MGSINGKLSGRGTYIDTNNDGTVDGLVHTIKNAGNFNTFSISNGILTIQGPSGGSAVGGSSTHVQYNQGGALKGETGFTYNETSNTLSVPNLTVSGELVVTTTTTLNSNTVTIGDSILVLNSDATGSASADAGIEIERGDDTNVQLLWDESTDKWDFDGYGFTSVGAVHASGAGAVYSFTSDTNTGIEHTGADQLGLLVNATRVLMVNVNGVEIKPAGATGAGSNQALVVDNISVDTNTITSIDTDGDLNLGANGNGAINITPAGTGDVVISTDTLWVIGAEGESATLKLVADESDDVSDEWHVEANTDGTLTIENDIASNGVGVPHLTITPHATVTSSTTAVAGHLTVAGNLTVSGASTTVSSTNTHVADTIITLNSGEAGNGITGNLAGFEIDRGDDSGVDNDVAKFLFDDSDDSFKTLLGSAAAPIVTGNITAPIIVIDQNNTVTTNQTVKALSVDFDATGITASGQTANYTALDIALNTDAPTQVGTVNNKGIDVTLTAATSGTQTNTGLDVTVGGADTNYSALFNGGNVGIGTSTPTAPLHVIATDTGDNLILESSASNSSTSAPNLVLFRNGSDAVANNDLIGQIVFRGENTAGTPQPVEYATIEAGIDDKTDGSEDGHITFNLIEAGTLTEFMRIRGSTRDVVVNDQADDIDFRVESENNQNMLFVDANEDRVGIGTDAPGKDLEVNAAASPTIRIREGAEGGYLDLVGYADSQSQIHHTNTTAGENAMLDIDVTSVNSQTQNIRLFRNSNADALGFLQILEPGTSTVKAIVAADTGKIALGTGITTHSLATLDGSIALKEQAAADTDTAAYGQLWVKTATPNELYFTTDAGNDIQLTSGTSIAGGGGGGTVDLVSNVASDRILGRVAVGSGDSQELSPDQVRTLINVADGATANTAGIASGNVATFTSGVADNDFLKVAGTVIEGRSAAQTLSDIGGMSVAGGTFAGNVTMDRGLTFKAGRAEVDDLVASAVPHGTANNVELEPSQQPGMILLATSATTNIHLPDPGSSDIGQTYVIINTTGGNVTIDRSGTGTTHGVAQTLNGGTANGTLASHEAVTLIFCGGAGWYGIGL